MVDANLNLLPVANQYFARSDYVYNVGWNDSGMPITVNYDNTVTGCKGRSIATAISLMPA